MAKFIGKMVLDKDGFLAIKMQIASENPEIYEIPLNELIENFLNIRVKIEIIEIEKRWEKK